MFGEGLNQCFYSLKRHSRSTPPLAISNSRNASSTTATSSSSTSASVVFKNFNSLYDPAASDSETLTVTLSSGSAATAYSSLSSASSSISGEGGSSPTPSDRDLSTAIASRRFFPASPGRSKSILDSAAIAVVGKGAGVAVRTYSPDPYRDFRRSMEEMVAALGLEKGVHWAHLHELLLCYLSLNQKQDHKYIIVAFAHLLLGLTCEAEEEGDA
ncbi:uncharacterized protein [Typha latifolia]|uniref:uncharacterized protein n=1 Tax=Typha latifolia TaxID=4733 RepID=UPI003C307772